ncbi:DUF4270 family protein [Geofilum sp. OHC36d9]|uniref:DUF4270 family protein n=1 Tax=Geofilum sp. OHC36d9 TaxID=3458413 RepID=UPI004033B976
MQNLKQRLATALGSIVLSSLIIVGCTNDPSNIGGQILPTSDLITANADSQKMVVKNILPESILSDGTMQGAVGFIGHFNDPRLGSTKSDFVTEVNIGDAIDSLDADGLNYFPDSVVLNLYYTNYSWFGDKDASLNLKVYELTERLSSDQPYYSNEPMDGRYNPVALGEKRITPYDNRTDSLWSAYKADTIQIRLTDELASRLFDVRNISTGDKSERDAFKDILNGLYVTLDNSLDVTNGVLLRIDLLNTLSNLTLYYHKEFYDLEKEQILAIESHNYVFPINEEGRIFNRFEHTYTSNVIFNDTDAGQVFAQGMAGSYMEVDLSDIYEQWADSVDHYRISNSQLGFSVVELILKADTTTLDEEEDLYLPKSQTLSIKVKNEDGKFTYPSYEENNESYMGFSNSGQAGFNSEKASFTFSMSKDYFQFQLNKVLSGETPDKLFIRLPSTQFNPYRIVIYNNHETYFPKVKVKYVVY